MEFVGVCVWMSSPFPPRGPGRLEELPGSLLVWWWHSVLGGRPPYLGERTNQEFGVGLPLQPAVPPWNSAVLAFLSPPACGIAMTPPG